MRLKNLSGDMVITFKPKDKLDQMIARYSDVNGPTLLQAYNQGSLTEEQLIKVVTTLEINGYSKKDIYDLPFSFAKRILGSEDLHGNN